MSHRHALIDLGNLVNAAVTFYVAVHNKIFNDSATLMSVVKNLFGIGAPVEDQLIRAEQLLPLWSSVEVKIGDFETASRGQLNEEEQKFLSVLKEYSKAIRLTIENLVTRQRILLKVKETGKNELAWAVYQASHGKYEEAMMNYQRIGSDLNLAYRRLLGAG